MKDRQLGTTSPWGPYDDTDGWRDAVRRIVATHLSPNDAARWLTLLRPAIRLSAAPDGPVVARLGGRPHVPAGFAWPVWDGHGPLSFVAEVDLAAIARCSVPVGLSLPTDGRLLAFYFDGSYDDFHGIVGTWDKESLAGARLIHVSESRDECVEHAAPEGVPEFNAQELRAAPIVTWPNWEHPALEREFRTADQDTREWLAHAVNADEFVDALWSLHGDGPFHQIGGWAMPEQGPVELEVAQAALDVPFDYGDGTHTAEGLRWSLVLQVDSDDASDMMWGDVGKLYWLSRGASGSDTTLDVSFTWQCG